MSLSQEIVEFIIEYAWIILFVIAAIGALFYFGLWQHIKNFIP